MNTINNRIVLDCLLRIGDRVQVQMDETSEGWGYRKPEDKVRQGRTGTVFSFKNFEQYEPRWGTRYGLTPGIYIQRGTPLVRFDDGSGDYIQSSDLAWLGDDLQEQRQAERVKENEYNMGRLRLGDLPELPFWEHDRVQCEDIDQFDGADTYIVSIDYYNIKDRRNDGSPMPIYRVSAEGWGTMTFGPKELVLVSRGDVYKHYHGEKPVFKSLKAEGEFYTNLGHAQDQKNPRTGDYHWVLEDVLAAIKDEVVDGFSMSNGWFGAPASIVARKFDDRELGRRIANATLEGFSKR